MNIAQGFFLIAVLIGDKFTKGVLDMDHCNNFVQRITVNRKPCGDLMADARLEIEDLESLLGLDLLPDDQDDDVDTLGGLLFTLAGYIPEVGETIEDKNGLRYEIMEGDARKIKTVLIRRRALSGSELENNQDTTS